jgi:predicted metal-dependent enzyme (double-stranded beta helix superfamily)
MFDQERFTEACLEALQDPLPMRAVEEIVREAVGDPGGIERVLGTPSTAGINIIHRSEELTIVNVIWAPKMAIYPHDHRTWAVIGIYGGREDNAFYRRRKVGRGLEQVNGRSLGDEETIILGEEVVHAVTNPLLQYTGAIHVYGGDFFAIPRSEWDSPEAAEQPYNVDHTLRTFAEANERAKELLATG